MSDNNLTVEQPEVESQIKRPKRKKDENTGFDNREVESIKASMVAASNSESMANSLNTPAIQNGATTYVEVTKASATSFQEKEAARAEANKGFGIGAAPAA